MAGVPPPLDPPPRVLVAKPGLDGHDRGARIVVRALREAGFEVAYTGIRRTPEQIAEQAQAFGAEVVGVSTLSGAHMELIPRLMDALDRRGLETVRVMAGGIIPESDREALSEMGVVAIFGPGTSTADILTAMREVIASARLRRTPRP